MATHLTIQGVNYKEITTDVVYQDFDIIPFDFGGKPLTEMTIVVDSTFAITTINLPEISSFAGVYGTTIKVIATTGATNDVKIQRTGGDTIGSAADVLLTTDGANAIFTVAKEGIWSVLVTV